MTQLPASIREALDDYGIAMFAAGKSGGEQKANARADALRTALEAHIGALVADAERSNSVLLWAADSVVAAYHEIGPNCRAFAQAIEDLDTAVAALTPPEDTTPHESQ